MSRIQAPAQEQNCQSENTRITKVQNVILIAEGHQNAETTSRCCSAIVAACARLLLCVQACFCGLASYLIQVPTYSTIFLWFLCPRFVATCKQLPNPFSSFLFRFYSYFIMMKFQPSSIMIAFDSCSFTTVYQAIIPTMVI